MLYVNKQFVIIHQQSVDITITLWKKSCRKKNVFSDLGHDQGRGQ